MVPWKDQKRAPTRSWEEATWPREQSWLLSEGKGQPLVGLVHYRLSGKKVLNCNVIATICHWFHWTHHLIYIIELPESLLSWFHAFDPASHRQVFDIHIEAWPYDGTELSINKKFLSLKSCHPLKDMCLVLNEPLDAFYGPQTK